MDSLEYLPSKTWLLVIGVVGLTTYYLYHKQKNRYFKQIGVPGPTPLPFIGTGWKLFIKGIYDHDAEVLQKYGKIAGLREGGRDVMLISDEAMIREIMVKQFNNFANRRTFDSFSDDVLDKMLTVLKDENWKRVRSMLTPTFSTGKLKQMCKSVNECGELFVENLGHLADSGNEFEMKEQCGAFTMDVIARTAFGIKVDSQKDKDNDFVKYANEAFNFKNPLLIVAFLCPWTVPLLKKLGVTFIKKRVNDFFINIVEQTLEGRKSVDINRQDFLQLMMNAHREDFDAAEVAKEVAEDGITFDQEQKPQKGLSKLEILAQGFLFFLAGFDTTANGLSLLLYNLACNPECQIKAQEEIDSVMGDADELSYSDVQSMKYLDQCFMESLRRFPPAPRVDRVASNDMVVNGIPIRKDTVIGINIQGIHLDPAIWPEPRKYDPDRFSPEERAKHSPFDHMPFGYGPRNCIAMRLALMEVKMAAALVLKNFTIKTCEKTQIPLKFVKIGTQKAEKGIWLKIERR